MKAILMEDLQGKGRRGEIVECARSFVQNYLAPNGIAVEATRRNLALLERGGLLAKRGHGTEGRRP